jgi:hypothetical protein
MTKDLPRNHHYVPQFYLKQFARDPSNPVLFVVDLKGRRTFSTNPRNVAASRDFNRLDVEGVEPGALERGYAAFEGKVDDALGRITKARSIAGEEDLIAILNFATLLAVRNPRLRATMGDFMARVSKGALEIMLSTPERWAVTQRQMLEAGVRTDQLSYEQMKDFFERDEYDITFDRETHIRMELESFEDVLPYFIKRKWRLLRTERRRDSFITCDHPICNVWVEPQSTSFLHGPGYGSPNSEVLFPLTSALALVGRFDGVASEDDVGSEYVAAYNSTVATFAERQVYARDDAFLYYSGEKLRRGVAMKGDRNFIRN